MFQPLRTVLSNSPSRGLCVPLGHSVATLGHCALLVFFPNMHRHLSVILDRVLEKVADPVMEQSTLVFFLTRFLDAVVSALQVVRCMSTQNRFPRDVLLNSHAYKEMVRL